MKPKTVNLFQVNAAVLIWGGTAMFAKGIALPVAPIIGVRSLFAAAALFAFMAARGTPWRVRSARHAGAMAVLGLLLCFHWLTYFAALRISSAAVAILALHTYPVFTALIEPFLFREKLRRADVALALGVLAGVVVMTPEINLSNNVTRGIALGIVSGLFFMARNLMTRKYVRHYASSTLMFWQVLVTGLVLLPFILRPGLGAYTPRITGMLVLLGVVFSAVPHTLYSASFTHLSAKTVGVLATLLPFYGAFFGYWIHNETLSPRTAIGGLIILVCIVIETVKSARD